MNTRKLYEAIYAGKPRTHSYGFAQLYLAPNVRLHLFSGEICAAACIPDQVSVRHDHRYDFRSTVLKGCVVDQPCQFVVPSDDFEFRETTTEGKLIEPWREFRVRPAHEVIGVDPATRSHLDMWKNGNVAATERTGYIVEGRPRVVRAGESYDMKGGDFHATLHVGETLSLFKRTDPSDRPYSRLIVPPGYDAVHSGEVQPPIDWLRSKFLDAIVGLTDPETQLIVEEAGL